MANHDDDIQDPTPDGELEGVPIEGEEVEEAPRREASAEFVINSEAGSDARLREAMDPANQSLTDALRLSFRLLQVGILALLAVFLFSGFQTVEEGDVGVKTRFGAIVGDQGLEQIGPGLHPFWPYPVGEIVVVPQVREVKLLNSFWPMSKNARSSSSGNRQNIDANVSENTQLRPGIDGYLITAGGDLAHCEVTATYQIADAASYLRELAPRQGDKLVEYALERGVVLSAAEFTLEQFTTLREEPATRVKERAQEVLDSLDSGIDLLTVQLNNATEPLAIRSEFRDVQQAREEAKEAMDRASQAVATEFTKVAGEQAYSDLLKLINHYNVMAPVLSAVREATEEMRSACTAEAKISARASCWCDVCELAAGLLASLMETSDGRSCFKAMKGVAVLSAFQEQLDGVPRPELVNDAVAACLKQSKAKPKKFRRSKRAAADLPRQYLR